MICKEALLDLRCEGLGVEGRSIVDLHPALDGMTLLWLFLKELPPIGSSPIVDGDQMRIQGQIVAQIREPRPWQPVPELIAFDRHELGFAAACPLRAEDHLEVIGGSSGDLQSLNHWNSGEIVFLRCENYMQAATTRRKMRFLGADGERVRVTYAFPIYRHALAAWNAVHGRDKTWREVTVDDRAIVYAMNRSEVERFVASEIQRSYWEQHHIQSDEPPALQRFTDHVIKLEMSSAVSKLFGFYVEDEDRHQLDFDMKFEVVIADRPLVKVIGEEIL